MFSFQKPGVHIIISIERLGEVNMARILWIVLAVIIVIWLVGFLMDVAGGLIHILLIIAAIILVINLISGKKGL